MDDSFHLLPSGLINPKCSGVVFHVPSFFKELKELDDLPNVYDRILVSDRVHIDFDLHAAVDGLEEIELRERKIGTTGQGIISLPLKSGIRLADVFDEEARYGDLLKYDVYRGEFAKYAVDGVSFMHSAKKDNMNILIEGANALMLDLDQGSYPYVTSSNTTISGIIGGLTLNPKNVTETIGVTRVGAGAFKTEDLGEVGTKLQEVGREWVCVADLVVVKYSNNYYTSLNLTKMRGVTSYPADQKILDRAEVIYHEMPGWNKPTTNAKTYYDLPKLARDYVEYIENFVGVKVGLNSWKLSIGKVDWFGPDREAMIKHA
ncbi:P-loop containing nucleoside triphosphate hydrolase protein [Thelonectria olida]|uniref:Adenylosuccinate synthetase n=1 Tax=Thelonectria olida TaxID=1576542 RepID=A0A9P8WGZ8_9HYPO|nr:P-loop containing nucleoside triphosphate hydrolase protein [Thelonectria olida]